MSVAERVFWDAKGQDDYVSLSPRDQQVVIDWIGPVTGRVLELGGGAGMVSRLIGGERVCLDLSAEMLRHSPVPAVQADGMQLPVASGSVDLVVCAAFFHHLPDDYAKVIAEAARVLRPGGRIVGYDPSSWCVANRVFMGEGPLRAGVFSPEERPLDPEQVWSALESVGFSLFRAKLHTFHNERQTLFERVQRYLEPLARHGWHEQVERWFLWRATA